MSFVFRALSFVKILKPSLFGIRRNSQENKPLILLMELVSRDPCLNTSNGMRSAEKKKPVIHSYFPKRVKTKIFTLSIYPFKAMENTDETKVFPRRKTGNLNFVHLFLRHTKFIIINFSLSTVN